MLKIPREGRVALEEGDDPVVREGLIDNLTREGGPMNVVAPINVADPNQVSGLMVAVDDMEGWIYNWILYLIRRTSQQVE